MARNRLIYLAALLGSFLLWLVWGQWLSALLLAWVALLPWFSLAVSLAAICRFRPELSGQRVLLLGQPLQTRLLSRCVLPAPAFRCDLKHRCCLTGEHLPKGSLLRHCGGIRTEVVRLRVCDYLGLWAFPARKPPALIRVVRPRPVAMELPPEFPPAVLKSGSFSDTGEYTPRSYRPGDRASRIHWKLTARTGKLTVRGPLQPADPIVVSLDIRGSRRQLDEIFGKTLWLGQYLLERQLPFWLHGLTDQGLRSFYISRPDALEAGLDALLCSGPAAEGSLKAVPFRACWRSHVEGGQSP